MGKARITEGMEFDAYRAIDAVNWSTLKHMATSAKHYRHAVNAPDHDTPALAFGRAVHTAVLEPDAFPLRYVVFDGSRRAGKVWEEFEAGNENRSILKREEYDECLNVRNAVMGNELASALLYGRSELVIEWTDDATGINCKARLDHVNADGEIVDLKTTGSVDSFEFERTSAKMLYHAQLAFYRRGLGSERRPRIIAVEKSAPYDVAVFALNDDAVYAGEQHVEEMLRRLAMYRELDEWPGRYQTEQELGVPSWMLDADDGAMEGWGAAWA